MVRGVERDSLAVKLSRFWVVLRRELCVGLSLESVCLEYQ
jgi:hypothetical protein